MPPFQGSSSFVAMGSFVDKSVNISVQNETREQKKGAGIDALRKASLPEAIHDSDARDPPPCLKGTRETHISLITDWRLGGLGGRRPRVLWLQGPAGVGKSAVAQTCAESTADGWDTATFFFSRLNQRNKSTRFLSTIIYQLAVNCPAYGDLVDARILRDPFILEKVFEVQFRELLMRPLRKLSRQDLGIDRDIMIIIDGLDECDDEDAQRVIIKVVTTSAHQQTTPFLWAFSSRPEPHIAAAFESKQANEVHWKLTLPVSRDADRDIEAYLRDSFERIRAKYQFPVTLVWPSEEDIRRLVDQSAGLFIYPASAVRCIDENSGALGPDAKLQSVLALGKPDKSEVLERRALSHLDAFYKRIMEQIPKDILPNTLLLLFTQLRRHTSVEDLLLPINCSILGFSLATFYASISKLHSVLEVQMSNGSPSRLSFYHPSFPDFLLDIERSTAEFCVETPDVYNRFYSKCVDTLCRLSDFNPVNAQASILAWPGSEEAREVTYTVAVRYISWSLESPLVHPDPDVLQRLSGVNWSLVTERCQGLAMPAYWEKAFFGKVASKLWQDWAADNV